MIIYSRVIFLSFFYLSARERERIVSFRAWLLRSTPQPLSLKGFFLQIVNVCMLFMIFIFDFFCWLLGTAQ